MGERFDWARDDVRKMLPFLTDEELKRVVGGKLWTTHSFCGGGDEKCLLGHAFYHDDEQFPVLAIRRRNEETNGAMSILYRSFDILGDHDLEGTVAWVKGEAARLLEERSA